MLGAASNIPEPKFLIIGDETVQGSIRKVSMVQSRNAITVLNYKTYTNYSL